MKFMKIIYEYNPKILEQLIKITDGTSSTLINNNKNGGIRFNPQMILKDNKTITLKWEGRRLVQYGSNKYLYIESGVRVYKETQNFNDKYRVDGKKV